MKKCAECGKEYGTLDPQDEILHKTNEYHVLTKKISAESDGGSDD